MHFSSPFCLLAFHSFPNRQVSSRNLTFFKPLLREREREKREINRTYQESNIGMTTPRHEPHPRRRHRVVFWYLYIHFPSPGGVCRPRGAKQYCCPVEDVFAGDGAEGKNSWGRGGEGGVVGFKLGEEAFRCCCAGAGGGRHRGW